MTENKEEERDNDRLREMREMVKKDPSVLIAHVPFMREIGTVVDHLSRGTVTLKVAYQDKLVGNNDTGVIHGGVITALLDNASGVAVGTALPEPQTIATLDLRIDYMKPATPGQDIRAKCECYNLTKSIAFTRGVAYHEDEDDPIAVSTGTFMRASTASPPPTEIARENMKKLQEDGGQS